MAVHTHTHTHTPSPNVTLGFWPEVPAVTSPSLNICSTDLILLTVGQRGWVGVGLGGGVVTAQPCLSTPHTTTRGPFQLQRRPSDPPPPGAPAPADPPPNPGIPLWGFVYGIWPLLHCTATRLSGGQEEKKRPRPENLTRIFSLKWLWWLLQRIGEPTLTPLLT